MKQQKNAEKKIKRIRVLERPIDALTQEEALEIIRRNWKNRDRVMHIITANPETIYCCGRDKTLEQCMEEADMVTADGTGVVLASRLMGSPLPQRVAGYDLMRRALFEAEQLEIPVFLLGAEPEVLRQAVEKISSEHPALNLAGSHHGYFREEEEEEAILRKITAARPGLLLVAMGVPRQEKWIWQHKEKLPPCVAIGVGGSFDILAGKTKRAPLWMQKSGLEWLYRLAKEPRRLRRIALVLPLFLFKVTVCSLQNRLPSKNKE